MPMFCKHCGAIDYESYKSNPRSCKDCVKRLVRENRAKNLERYQAYDRVRYYDNGARGEASSEAKRRAKTAWADRNKDKRAAHVALNNAVRDGKLSRPVVCSQCKQFGGDIEAHHEDYSKPLDVTWLCTSCHGHHTRKYDEQESRHLAKVK